MEDVHRAGGIPAILGELYRGGLLDDDVHSVHADSLGDWLKHVGRARRLARPREAVELFHAAPGCVRSADAFSQSERWESLDTDAAGGCIRDVEHAYSTDGGLAVLRGNLAEDGCVVKTAGVDESIWTFEGPAVVVRVPGGRGRGDPRASGSRRATSSSSATRVPRAAPACRRCSTPRRSSRAAASARRAR